MSQSPSFEKIAECLYRNPSSRAYYSLVKVKGKQHKRSLKTTDLAEAKRNGSRHQVNPRDNRRSRVTIVRLKKMRQSK